MFQQPVEPNCYLFWLRPAVMAHSVIAVQLHVRCWVQPGSKRNPDERRPTSGAGGKHPHVAEFIIGRRFAPARWLMRATAG